MDKEMTARLRLGAVIRRTNAHSRPSVNMLASLETPPHNANKTKNQCYVCKSYHYVDGCARFQEMSPNERWEVVKNQKACFSCLKRGHAIANCLRKKECSERNGDSTVCKRHHNKLLHTEESPRPLQVASIQDQSLALLPVLTGAIKAPQNGDVYTEPNIFYDSGAQISMIRSSFAKSLSLESKPVKVLITKVGRDTEEELATNLYKFPICTADGKTVQVIQAVGIPQIADTVGEVYVSLLAKIFGLGVNEVRRKAGPIDFLIGINCSRFHVGETKVKVKDSLVARKSPLGWVIFGSNAEGQMPEVKQASLVRLAVSVDLTDIWKTESMGVAVSPCTCEASKLSLQEREELRMIEESCQLQGENG